MQNIEHQSWEIAAAEQRLFVSDYPYTMRPLPYEASIGGAYLLSLIEQSSANFLPLLQQMRALRESLKRISVVEEFGSAQPAWVNGMLPGLDSASIYTLIRSRNPTTYLEVGSGNSTKFVRRAISDGGLRTKLISIDPSPRAEVDALCDVVLRQPFESLAERDYAGLLDEESVVFIDNSHRSFPNSDVTVFFTETIAVLPPGVIYGLHDIFLPDDYPTDWMDRFYNEQYLLAAYLLGGAGGDEIVFAAAYVSKAAEAQTSIGEIFAGEPFRDVARHGGGFWLRKAARRA